MATPQTTDIQKAYDAWSKSYDSQSNKTRDLDALVLPRFLKNLSGQRVVECGCGTGKNTGWLLSQGATVTALDFSAGMLAQARNKHPQPQVSFVEQDLLEPWRVETDWADWVMFNLVLEHLPELDQPFREAIRVLKPGGRMLISEFHPDRLARGRGAKIETDRQVHLVGSFYRSSEDFVASGSLAGFRLQEQQSAGDRGRAGQDPRLLVMVFQKGLAVDRRTTRSET